MAGDNSIIAAQYRYFTTDLLSNEVLMEIPFSGVSWERALNAGGAFAGTIPVIDATTGLGLYENTMPGQTGLYVVRNGVCVWGGIIWSRSYDVTTNILSVSGTEFTSYLHHRLIWKTVNYQYSATVTVGGGTCAVVFDNGSSSALNVGASVQLEFFDPSDFTYNGYYTIADDPAPTTSSFSTTLAAAVAQIQDIRRTANLVTVDTVGFHGFSTGDSVTLTTGTSWDGTYVINADQGSDSTVFTFTLNGPDEDIETISGTATRPIPDGEYDQVTVTTRADTYDYVRGLVSSIFDDFMGIDFADDYLTPGLSYQIDIINKKLGQNYATMATAEPHQLAVGQAVQVENVGFPFDGLYEVVRTPDNYTFMYNQGGTIASTPISPIVTTITARALGNFIATVYTSTPHGYSVGNTVTIDAGDNMDGLASIFNGPQTIITVNSPTSFSYSVIDDTTAAKRGLTRSTATVGTSTFDITESHITSNVASVATTNVNTFSVGNSVTVRGLNISATIASKSLDAANHVAEITTTAAHQFSVGDAVSITGLRDTSTPTAIATDAQTGTATSYTNRTNQFNNPSAIATIAGYSAYGSATTITLSTGNFTYLSSIPVTAALSQGVIVENINVSASSKLLPNTTYTYSGTIGGAVGGAHLLVTGTGVASVTSPDPSPVVGTMFSEALTFTTAASGTVTFSVVNALAISVANVATVSFDRMLVEKGYYARAYFDGGTATSGIFTFVWAGSANASASMQKVSGFANQSITVTTTPAHNFKVKDVVTVENMTDNYTPTQEAISGGVATLTIGRNNLEVGSSITVAGVTDSFNITSRKIQGGIATLNLDKSHGFAVNDSITIRGVNEAYNLVAKEIQNFTVILTTSADHNIQVSQKIVVAGAGAPFNGSWVVTAVTDRNILYKLPSGSKTTTRVVNSRTHKVTYKTVSNATQSPTKTVGTVTCTTSVMNGTFVISGVPGTGAVQVAITANDVPVRALSKASLIGDSPVNGTYTVTGVPNVTQVTYATTRGNLSSRPITIPSGVKTAPTVTTPSFFNGDRIITKVTRTTFSWTQNTRRLFTTSAKAASGGDASVSSIFNGTHTITVVPSPTTLRWTQSATSSVLEEAASLPAYVTNSTIFNGTYTITGLNTTTNSFTYARTHSDIASQQVSGYGTATVAPTAVVSTYGSYPGNTDLGIEFSTQDYSGVNVTPTAYRGYALTNAGDALDTYSGTTDGFDYRIDCDYDGSSNKFTRTFVMTPIDFPNPPPIGVPSDPSRFGADKLVFEYPGSISAVKLDESAENSTTRFFVVGNADLGDDTANPYSAASATDLLNAQNTRSWPILDDSESVDDITDENVLYAYASQYLAENRPPSATFTISVDGSLDPIVDTYHPGDWCSIIVDDDFLKQRLASNLEPRNTVIVRKIDSYKVSVPDGITFPETVDLTLVAEWDVDKVSTS